jgi:UDP-3-O-[3-hydroxymyristoyl] glucosamine N-acyltransferase
VEYEEWEIHAIARPEHVEIYALGMEARRPKVYAAYCGNDASSFPDDFKFGDAKVIENAIVSEGAWVYADAVIRENAKVSGGATICGHAIIENAARVRGCAKIRDHAMVGDNALVDDDAEVSGDVVVYDCAKVYNNAKIYYYAQICGNARVCDSAEVSGRAKISGSAKIGGHARVRNEAEVSGTAEMYGHAQASGKARVVEGKWGKQENIWGEDVVLDQDRIYDIEEQERMKALKEDLSEIFLSAKTAELMSASAPAEPPIAPLDDSVPYVPAPEEISLSASEHSEGEEIER